MNHVFVESWNKGNHAEYATQKKKCQPKSIANDKR